MTLEKMNETFGLSPKDKEDFAFASRSDLAFSSSISKREITSGRASGTASVDVISNLSVANLKLDSLAIHSTPASAFKFTPGFQVI